MLRLSRQIHLYRKSRSFCKYPAQPSLLTDGSIVAIRGIRADRPALRALSSVYDPIRFPLSSRGCTAARRAYSQSTSSGPPPVKPSSLQKIASKSVVLSQKIATKSLLLTKSAILATLRAVKITVTDPKAAWKYVKDIGPAVKEVAHHYWVGSKLLATQVSIATRLLKRLLQGKTLNRSERRLLTRTAADLLRVIPFVVIVVIPFMELALPLLLKLFPNMLPSTFEDKLKKEEKLKQRLKVKLEMARVLQDTAIEMAKQVKEGDAKTAADHFLDFTNKVRSGAAVSNAEILQFAKLFKDEMTLDNLPRGQLVAMCKYMGIPNFGSDALLRFQLRNRLRQLKKDDRDIFWEGIDTLTDDELRSASRARGMRASGLSREALQKQLSEWIELSMTRDIPSSLLILSRAFIITDNERPEEVLQATLSSMPDTIVDEMYLETAKGDAALNKKLQVLQRQRDLMIEQEANEERDRETAVRKDQKQQQQAEEAAEKRSQRAAAAEQAAGAPGAQGAAPQPLQAQPQGTAPSSGASAGSLPGEAQGAEEVRAREEAAASAILTGSEQELLKTIGLEELSQAVSAMASSSAVSSEKKELAELLARELDLQADVMQKDENVLALRDKVHEMLSSLSEQVQEADKEIGGSLKILDQDGDGMISEAELEHAAQMLKVKPSKDVIREAFLTIDRDRDGKIHVEEFEALVKEMHDSDAVPPTPPQLPAPTPTPSPAPSEASASSSKPSAPPSPTAAAPDQKPQ